MTTPSSHTNSEKLFAAAFKQNLNKVKYFAYSYLKDTELAENIAQEAFIQLWKNKERINLNENVLPYLLVVARNLCLNIIKGQKCRITYANYKQQQSKESLNYAALEDSSSTSLYSKEIEQLLQAGLEKMPDTSKQAFMLSRFKNLNYQEIAQIQNVAVKTVESRMTIALKTLRKVFKDYMIFIIGWWLS